MYSLLQAAPYDTTISGGGGDTSNESYLPQQRRTSGASGNARTIKKRPISQSQQGGPGQPLGRKKCVEALMMMTGGDSDDDDDNGLADFQPPAKPELTRVPNAIGQQGHEVNRQSQMTATASTLQGSQTSSQPSSYSVAHSPPAGLRPDMNAAIAAVQSAGVGSNAYQYSSPSANQSVSSDSTKSISEQLNYIIHLLEEQQNTKTSTTTEELILYSFLGVFTIYIVDSFTKVGKSYTR